MHTIAYGDHQYEFPGSTDEAILEAKTTLELDPELGHVEVYQDDCYIGQATHVPDRDWQSVVGWLWDGERVLPPAGVPLPGPAQAEAYRQSLTPEEVADLESEQPGYDLDDPKHPTFHERMSDFADLRD